eukprot:15434-Pyramimonas_sp.AAC.1
MPACCGCWPGSAASRHRQGLRGNPRAVPRAWCYGLDCVVQPSSRRPGHAALAACYQVFLGFGGGRPICALRVESIHLGEIRWGIRQPMVP